MKDILRKIEQKTIAKNQISRFEFSRMRLLVLWWAVFAVFMILITAAFYKQILSRDFLLGKAEQQILKTEKVRPLRGMLLDRNGVPLAVSSPVMTVAIDPVFYSQQFEQLKKAEAELAKNPTHRESRDKLTIAKRNTYDLEPLAKILGLDVVDLKQEVARKAAAGRKYYVLKREVTPQDVDKIKALRIAGVKDEVHYKRYYPQPQPNAQIIGMTGLDENGNVIGIEGLEKQLNQRLTGEEGEYKVEKDKGGAILNIRHTVKEEKPGENIALSLDSRLQYIMYRELARIGVKHKARYASGIAVDVKTGEILAMNTWPSYNPNDKNNRGREDVKRNRGAVDQFEPGSTIKPFSVAMGLEKGKYRPNTVIDTSPGKMQLGNNVISDTHNYGALTVTNIIKKSSNIGVAKIALSFPLSDLPQFYQKIGFGQRTAVDMLGERSGKIQDKKYWTKPTIGTMAYGYGLDVTMLQIAQAYAMLANEGKQAPLTIFKQNKKIDTKQMISAKVANQVMLMMEKVTQEGGTATGAAISGYRVAGKTGTARKLKTDGSGYADNVYRGLFAGAAPVSNPRIAMVIVVDEPSTNGYYGGVVAAPAFAKIMQESLRLMNVPFDKAITEKELTNEKVEDADMATQQKVTPTVSKPVEKKN